jgi:hypothetical protein
MGLCLSLLGLQDGLADMTATPLHTAAACEHSRLVATRRAGPQPGEIHTAGWSPGNVCSCHILSRRNRCCRGGTAVAQLLRLLQAVRRPEAHHKRHASRVLCRKNKQAAALISLLAVQLWRGRAPGTLLHQAQQQIDCTHAAEGCLSWTKLLKIIR